MELLRFAPEHVRETPSMRGRRFVVTSANAQRTAEIVGSADHVLEIIGKPYDIDAVVKAVELSLGRGDALPPGARKA